MPVDGRNRRTWTDDELAVAVHNSRSWRGVLRNLGLYADGPTHVVKREAERLGLDTSHFGSGARWTDAQLMVGLAEAASWAQLLSSIGMRPESRRSRQKVKVRAEQLGLNLEHLACPGRVRYEPSAELSHLTPDIAHLRHAAQSLIMAWFLLRGLWPAVPAEPRPYDLLLETPRGVKRVQVKSTTCTASSGSWYVSIGRHAGGGDRHNQKLPYRADEVDLFAIVDGEFMLHLIPMTAVAGRKAICLGPYRELMVGSAASFFTGWSGRLGPQASRPVHTPFATDLPRSSPESAGLLPAHNAFPTPSNSLDLADTDPKSAVAASQASDEGPDTGQPAHAPRWAEDELRAAAQDATSWADLLRAFGFKPSSTAPRRALRRELERHGIDTSHFVGQRTWSDQALIEAAATARTWTELLTALGLSTGSKSCDSVRAAARRLGVELGRVTLGPKTGREAIGIDLPDRPALDHLRNAAPSIAAMWFLLCGCAVSTPCEPEAYDLIVDLPDGLKRVQVKSTTSRDARGNWTARIGHRPDGSPKTADFVPYDADEVELFLIVDGDLLLYLIPATSVAGKTTLSLRG